MRNFYRKFEVELWLALAEDAKRLQEYVIVVGPFVVMELC